ncbi:MAG: amino acid adenylation domain-containing protein [Firmicutes bacterium]|nr:amino acid adenylation domain-containing protein [Bacillota bacterium]
MEKMPVVEFLSQLRKLDIHIWVENDTLRYQAPQGVMTPELLAELSQKKAEIIAFMSGINAHSTIEPAPPREYYPVSLAQKRFYILNQIEGAEITNISGAVKIEGGLDPSRLEETFKKLVKRHEAFRTAFELIEGELVQRIYPEVDFKIDYRQVEESQIIETIKQFIQPFNLHVAPLLRIKLLKVADEKHILLYDMCHIISDMMSMGILIREFVSLYRGESLPELPVQYKDFVAWQNKRGTDILKQEKYWLEQFSGEIPALELPSDYPRSAAIDYTGKPVLFTLGEELALGLKQLAAKRKATLFMTLLAAYDLLLSRLTGATGIIVGTTVTGRRHADLENIIGMFVNTIALKNKLDSRLTFTEFLEEVKQNSLKAFENQDYQFEMLLEKLKIPTDLNRNPLVNTLINPQSEFNMNNFRFEAGGLRFSSYEFPRQNSTFGFDLMIFIHEMKNNIQLEWIYRASLFRQPTIEYIIREYTRLLEEIVQNPEKRLEEYRLFDPKDIQKTPRKVKINLPFREFSQEAVYRSIIERFEEQVRLYPSKIAAQTWTGAITYEALNKKANQLARVILKEPADGQPVALLCGQNTGLFAGITGVLKAGRAYLPLDPSYPKERLAYMLSDSKAAVIAADSFNLALAAELIQKTGKKVRIIDLDKIDPKMADDNLNLAIKPEAIAYIKYTSGSTGRPKGIPQTHRNVLAFIRRYTNELHINSSDKVALFTSYSHSAGAIDIFSMLLNGGAIYPYDLKSDGVKNITKWLAAEGITIFHSVPMVFRHCTEGLAEGDLSRIRLVVLGGEPVSQKDVERFHQCFGRDCVLVNMFGATEVIIGTFNLIDQTDGLTGAQVPIGYPVEEVKIYLVDELNREAPVYGVGEIIYESEYLALDYLNLPEKSAEVYVPNPLTGKGRVFRSGDLGRLLPDGRIEFLGRKDFQVKIRGYRVELGEIEAALDNLPGIKKSVVTELKRAGENYLAAYYTVSGAAPDKGEIRRLLGRQLPDYMIPAYFVRLEEFPLTPNGKIDRKALPEPDVDNIYNAEVKYEAPRNEIESKLVAIWQEILKVERIGINDNFFELGGHSLKLSYLANRIYKEFGIELKISELYAAATICLTAGLIERKKSEVNKIEAALKRIKELSKN